MSIESGLKYFEFTKKPVPEFSEATIHPLLMDGVRVAHRLLPFRPEESEYLQALLSGNLDKTALSYLNQVVSNVATKVETKLGTVAMGVFDYFAAYNAFHNIDPEKFTKSLVERTEKKLNLGSVNTTPASLNPADIEAKHSQIISNILEAIPVHRKGEQKLVIVTGPFAGGKSETIHNKLDTHGALEIDLDHLRGRLLNGYDQTNQQDIQRVREESWVLSDILLRKALETGRSVIIQTALHREKRWLNDENLIFANRRNIDLEIYMLLRPVSDCLVRNIRRNGRTVSFKDLVESVNGMSVLPKVIERFQNTQKVVLMDYYPLIEANTGMKCVFGNDKYEALMKYAHAKQAKMQVQPQQFDIQVESQ